MAEPQNLRFRQFQAFFGCKGKKSNKNKDKGQFFGLFLIISQTKKIENRTTFGFLWIFGAKKGKSKNDPIFNFFFLNDNYKQYWKIVFFQIFVKNWTIFEQKQNF